MKEALQNFRMLAGIELAKENVEAKPRVVRASKLSKSELVAENTRLKRRVIELERDLDELSGYTEALVSRVKAEESQAVPVILDSLPGLQEVVQDQYTSPHKLRRSPTPTSEDRKDLSEDALADLVNSSEPLRI